ncbi:MAG TPA: DNA polymerase III subunit delta, partial [Cyclobacteriaceae bacterium]|nr:DNA polymerase III subunit delta [Cyclobacteriaceae bacterium]
MRFADVPGLYEIKNVLANAINEQQVAHAQLFLSAKGALNLPLAIAYASYLHCTNKTGTDSCGTCAACSKSLKFIHPDTHFIFPLSNVLKESDEDKQKANILKLWRNFLLEKPYGDEDDWLSFYGGEDKQANISKETARDIIKSLSLKPFESNYKVMIIWMPEYMHPSAANAILKILEEPAAQTVFLLVTNQAEKLLPTILSRTQIHSVPLLDDIELQSYLTDKLGFEKSKVESIITLAEGSINRAVKIMDNAEEDNRQTFTEWMRSCFKRE